MISFVRKHVQQRRFKQAISGSSWYILSGAKLGSSIEFTRSCKFLPKNVGELIFSYIFSSRKGSKMPKTLYSTRYAITLLKHRKGYIKR